ncbi:ABC transporter substrate-binding protein [Breznakiella homolactica]|uniref:Thiamine pyrimidine synthase n=1 Tax=Breznakiella homolactica TaxID=2798577 RepID=A0A7T7XQA8_9SPIR|nr:ABC transporter substrate-binding protein [Breznakiella homolactica]QQO10559.1 ABC transporter substrate-binding protein [Breznakiella homolactica]
MKRLLTALLIFACAGTLLFAKGSSDSGAGGTKKVTIQIEGSAVPYYTPIFTAIDRGYFAEEGLEVEYLFGNAADIAKNVSVGNVEFGFPNGEPIITAKSQGIPVMVVHSTLQHGLGSTIFLKDSGIRTPADLKGKKIAVTSFGSSNYVQLQVLLEKNGMSLKDVTVEIVGTEAIVPALVNKRVDAICFSMLRTFELQYQGIDVAEFRSDEFLPSFGNVLVTGKDYLEKNRETVQKFVRALNKSMEFIAASKDNTREAVTATIKNHTPTYAGREDYMTDIISEVYAGYLWTSDDTKKNGFGYGNVTRWQETADIMKQFEIITSTVSAQDMVVPDVLK